MAEAEMVLGICERFGKLPSEIDDEDADVLRLMQIEALGRPDELEGGDR